MTGETLNETPNDAEPVYAVGIGPGDTTFLTDRARTLLDRTDVVVGFESVTDRITGRTDADVLSCSYDNQTAILDRFGDRVAAGETGVAALWGDPNVSGYQFLDRVEAAVEAPVRVVPGVSSIQVAASRARTPFEHSTFASLHRRGDVTGDIDRLAADAGERHLLILVRPYDLMPPSIAAALTERGADPKLSALVLEDLTLPEESIEHTTLGSLADADEEYSDLSVMVVRAG